MNKEPTSFLNVLVVSSKYPPEYSGSGLRAHRTYQRLASRYPVRFAVLSSSIAENTCGDYEHEEVNVHRIAAKILPLSSGKPGERTWKDKFALRLNYCSEFWATWRYLRRHHRDYDLFHVFGNVAVTSAAITFCNKTRKPLIVEFCNEDATPYPYRPALFRVFDPRPFAPGTHFVCISHRLEAMCRRAGLTENLWTRPNPVDTTVFRPEPERKKELREKHTPFRADDILLVSVASFIPRKNHSFLVDVLARLPERFKLVLAGPLVGQGPERRRDREYLREIEQKVADHHLGSRVQVVPRFIERVDEFIKMADVFLFPPVDEGLGTPMLESLCCGVPVVANRIEGITDVWIRDGQNGYLSSLDAQEFAEKILRALELPPQILKDDAARLRDEVDNGVIDKGYWDRLQRLGRGERDLRHGAGTGKPLNIAQLTSVYLPVVGGAQICIHNVAERLHRQGHFTTVVTPWKYRGYKTGNYPRAFLWPGTVFLLQRFFSLGRVSLLWQVLRLQRRYRFDVWQVTVGFPLGAAVVDDLRRQGVPCLLCCPGEDIQVDRSVGYGMRIDPRIDRLARTQYAKFDGLLAYSRTVIGEYRRLSIPEKKLHLIPNGVDLDRFRRPEGKEVLRGRLNLPPDRKILLSVGRNHPKKGFQLTPGIIREMTKTRDDFLWVLAGAGNTGIVRRAREEGIGAQHLIAIDPVPEDGAGVRFPGDYLVDLYKAADVFVFPAYIETFGIVLLEAMAAGLPVVTTFAPGINDVVRNGETALQSEPGDTAAMAKNILSLLDDVLLYQRLREAVLAGSEPYDWDVIAGRYLDTYRSCLKGMNNGGRRTTGGGR